MYSDRSTLLMFFFALVVWGVPVPAINAEEQVLSRENAQILVNVARQFQSNVESIQTWQGEAIVVEKSQPSPGLIPLNRTAKVKFWVDVPQRKRMFISEPVEEVKQSYEGELYPVVFIKTSVLLLNNDSLSYRRTAIDPKGSIPLPGDNNTTEYIDGKDKHRYDPAVLRGHIYVSPNISLGANQSDISADFDPFRIMDLLGYRSLVGRFDEFAGLARDGEDVSDLFVRLNGTEISLIMRTKLGETVITNTLTVDSKLGGCPTEYHCYQPGVLDTRLMSEYEDIRGIYVPKCLRMDEKGKTLTVSFTKSTLNEPISEDVFSLRGLGAMRGDSVYDKRTDTNYYLDDEQYPLPDYANRAQRPAFYFHYTTAVGLFLVFAYLAIRYFKSRQKQEV